jgi:hypothetical protein
LFCSEHVFEAVVGVEGYFRIPEELQNLPEQVGTNNAEAIAVYYDPKVIFSRN